MQTFLETNKLRLRPTTIAIYLLILFLPSYVFVSQHGGFDFYQTDNFKIFTSLIYPMFGLYAFTLVWVQTIIGMNMFYFSRLFSNAVSLHRAQGLLALLFAATHVFLIQYIYGLQQYIGFKFLTADTRIFAFLGAIAFYLRGNILNYLWQLDLITFIIMSLGFRLLMGFTQKKIVREVPV